MLPPTPEALEQMYLEHDAFREKALQWDKNEELWIKEWEARKKELDQQYESRQLNAGENGEQTVESWDPSKPKHEVKENTDLVKMSEIDLLER